MQPSSGELFLAQKFFHHPAACKRILHMQFVDPAHHLDVRVAGQAWFIVETPPADPQKLGLL